MLPINIRCTKTALTKWFVSMSKFGAIFGTKLLLLSDTQISKTMHTSLSYPICLYRCFCLICFHSSVCSSLCSWSGFRTISVSELGGFCIIWWFSHVKWSFTFPKDTKYQLNANANECMWQTNVCVCVNEMNGNSESDTHLNDSIAIVYDVQRMEPTALYFPFHFHFRAPVIFVW